MIYLKSEFVEDDIYNIGLSIGIEFGKDWTTPTQAMAHRILKSFTEEEANLYYEKCRSVYYDGIEIFYQMLDAQPYGDLIKSKAFYLKWKAVMQEKYIWMNNQNVLKLFKQANFFAWENGKATGKMK